MRGWWLLWIGLCAGCTQRPAAYDEGLRLATADKHEEAAEKLSQVCLLAPIDASCGEADRRAAAARLADARESLARGEYLHARRQLLLAMASGDEETQRAARAELEGDALQAGLRLEGAEFLERDVAFEELEHIAAGQQTVAAERAQTKLTERAQRYAIAAVIEACGDAHRGSCSEAWARMQRHGGSGPEAERARVLAEAEQRRAYPFRRSAEQLLESFATAKQQQDAFDACMKTEGSAERAASCREIAYGDAALEASVERAQRLNNHKALWQSQMRHLGDPALVAALEARKVKAQQGQFQRAELPKLSPIEEP